MKNILYFIAALYLYCLTGCYSNRLIVNLQTVDGAIPYHLKDHYNMLIAAKISNSDERCKKIKFPPDCPDLQLASVHFQPFQYYHYQLLHGRITQKEFDKTIKLKNIDTKYYTDEYIDEEFIFGYKQLKDSSYVVYPDLNNNNDLSDEKPILNYDFYKTPYDFTNITSYPHYDIHFKYFDGEQVADSVISVVFCLGEDKIIIDTIVAGINVVQINKTHREGILSADDKTVKIISENGITMPTPRNCSIDIIDSVWADHHSDTYIPGDTIAVLNKYLLFDSQSPKGDKLIFYKLDDNIKPMGINPGYYAPNMQGVSLNNIIVSFNDVSNVYNLVVVKNLQHIKNEDIAYLNGLYDKYKNDNLNFICYSNYDDIGKISQLVKRTQLKWQVIGDLKKHPNNVVSHRELFSYLWQIDRRFYLMNKEGKILEGMDNDNKVQKVLRKYFGK